MQIGYSFAPLRSTSFRLTWTRLISGRSGSGSVSRLMARRRPERCVPYVMTVYGRVAQEEAKYLQERLLQSSLGTKIVLTELPLQVSRSWCGEGHCCVPKGFDTAPPLAHQVFGKLRVHAMIIVQTSSFRL